MISTYKIKNSHVYSFLWKWTVYHIEYLKYAKTVTYAVRKSKTLRTIDRYLRKHRSVSTVNRIRAEYWIYQLLTRTSKVSLGTARSYIIKYIKQYRFSSKIVRWIQHIIRQHYIIIHKRD